MVFKRWMDMATDEIARMEREGTLRRSIPVREHDTDQLLSSGISLMRSAVAIIERQEAELAALCAEQETAE